MTWWLLVACAKSGAPPEPAAPIVAGPRVVLEGEPVEDDGEGVSIGADEVVAYAQEVRVAVMPSFKACAAEAGAADDPVLVEAIVDGGGKTRDVVVSRSSGNRAVDECARNVMGNTMLPKPPANRLDAQGLLELPPFAFRAP